MVDGEAEIDMASLDPKRYGDWMTTEFAARKNEECYEHVYVFITLTKNGPRAVLCARRLPTTAKRRWARSLACERLGAPQLLTAPLEA